MKNQKLRSLALVAMVCLVAVGMASANAVSLSKVTNTMPPSVSSTITTFISFPSAGDTYCSASNGCGTIPSGGETDYMWTTGDYVVSSAFSLSTNPIVGLSANWSYENFLGDGNTETWTVFINSTPVAFFVAPDDSFNGNIYTVTGSVSFSAGTVPVASSYTVALVLQNSVPFGGGSIAFLDGGVTGITTASPVPEPGSLALLGSSVLGLAGLIRRKLS